MKEFRDEYEKNNLWKNKGSKLDSSLEHCQGHTLLEL